MQHARFFHPRLDSALFLSGGGESDALLSSLMALRSKARNPPKPRHDASARRGSTISNGGALMLICTTLSALGIALIIAMTTYRNYTWGVPYVAESAFSESPK